MKNLFWIVAFAAFFFISEGCKQDNRVGFDLIQDEQISSKADIITDIVSNTIGLDTIRTDNSSIALLGQTNDPIFGKTKAEFAIQFNLSGALQYRLKDSIKNINSEYEYFYHAFGKNPVIDSLVLFLAYDTAAHSRSIVMGDPSIKQSLDLRLLKDTLEAINYGYTKIAPYLSNESLGTFEHTFSPENQALRFKITNQEYVDTFLHSNTIAFESKNKFIAYKLKGLALLNNTADPSFLCRFNVSSAETKLRVYYRNDKIRLDGNDDVVYYDFKVDVATNRYFTYTRYFTEIIRDYTSSELEGKVDIDVPNDNGKIYVQSLGGARTLLQFPGVREWVKDEKKLIRSAQLVIRRVDEDLNDNFSNLDKLSVYRLNESGTMNWLAEYIDATNSTNIAEEYDPVDNEFRFDITSYVNQLKDDPSTDLGLVLAPQGRNVYFGRTTLHSAQSTMENSRMYVKISYSLVE